MQLHSANDQMTAHVNMAFSCPQNYDSLHRVGKVELNRLYLEGFPSDVQEQIRTRMMIKFPDHHPEDPYPIKDVCAAARFLLPGNSSVVPLPTSAQAQGPLPSPCNIVPQAPIYQQPTGGAVVKQEYHMN